MERLLMTSEKGESDSESSLAALWKISCKFQQQKPRESQTKSRKGSKGSTKSFKEKKKEKSVSSSFLKMASLKNASVRAHLASWTTRSSFKAIRTFSTSPSSFDPFRVVVAKIPTPLPPSPSTSPSSSSSKPVYLSPQHLSRLFSPYGKVLATTINIGRYGQVIPYPIRTGTVDFQNEEDGLKALEELGNGNFNWGEIRKQVDEWGKRSEENLATSTSRGRRGGAVLERDEVASDEAVDPASSRTIQDDPEEIFAKPLELHSPLLESSPTNSTTTRKRSFPPVPPELSALSNIICITNLPSNFYASSSSSSSPKEEPTVADAGTEVQPQAPATSSETPKPSNNTTTVQSLLNLLASISPPDSIEQIQIPRDLTAPKQPKDKTLLKIKGGKKGSSSYDPEKVIPRNSWPMKPGAPVFVKFKTVNAARDVMAKFGSLYSLPPPRKLSSTDDIEELSGESETGEESSPSSSRSSHQRLLFGGKPLQLEYVKILKRASGEGKDGGDVAGMGTGAINIGDGKLGGGNKRRVVFLVA